MRSNSLEVSGDLMAVAYQVTQLGLKPVAILDHSLYVFRVGDNDQQK
jgi:hypothetical protein